MNTESKNLKLREEFNQFCAENPSLRFWQALRAWSKADKILYELEGEQRDTYYWNGKVD